MQSEGDEGERRRERGTNITRLLKSVCFSLPVCFVADTSESLSCLPTIPAEQMIHNRRALRTVFGDFLFESLLLRKSL